MKFSSAFSCFQFFFKLRCEQAQKLGIAGNELALSISGAKHNCVARVPTKDGTAEVALHRLYVRAGLHELDTKRRQPQRACRTNVKSIG